MWQFFNPTQNLEMDVFQQEVCWSFQNIEFFQILSDSTLYVTHNLNLKLLSNMCEVRLWEWLWICVRNAKIFKNHMEWVKSKDSIFEKKMRLGMYDTKRREKLLRHMKNRILETFWWQTKWHPSSFCTGICSDLGSLMHLLNFKHLGKLYHMPRSK